MANRSNNKTLSLKLYSLVIFMVKRIRTSHNIHIKHYNSTPFIFGLIFLLAGISYSADAQSSFTTNATYTVPAGVSVISVQCWGAGGGGSSRSNNGQGGGGGGGAYASSQISVTPGSTYAIVVGAGGAANTAGGISSFTANPVILPTVLAAGGNGGTNDAVTAGTGGTVAASTGTIRFDGGNGGTGNATVGFSGAGGGVAGSSGAGGNALGAAAGTGTPTLVGFGGNGAGGVSGNVLGSPGISYGGGGSGASKTSGTKSGGTGAGGYVTITVISWCPPAFTSSVSNATGPIQSDGAVSVSNNVNPAMEFRKTDYDYVDLNTSFLSNLTQFSVEGWTKFNLADNVGTRVGSIFGQNDCIEFGFYDPTIIQCWTAGGGQVDIPVTSYPSDNAWHHIAAVGNGTMLSVYVDGILIGTGGISTTNYGTSAFTAKIGGRIWDDTDGGSFTGQIKKIGFWNIALTPAKITMLAAGYYIYKTSDTGLIAGYNFFEGSGTTLSSIPAGKNGTLKNSPVWSNIMTYAWTKTGEPAFTRTTSNISSLTTGVYNLIVSNGSCTSNNSFTVVSDNTCATYWTGATDSVWMTTSNWSAQYVPIDGAAVSFATVANNGTAAVNNLVLDIDRTVNSLTNLSAKRLRIPAGRRLTVNTTITTNNDPNQILIQASPILPNGTLTFHNAVDAPLLASVEMYSLASWNLLNPVWSKYKWQYFGIPLRALRAVSPTFDGAYVRQMYENDSASHWFSLRNSSSTYSFKGYEITQAEAKTYVIKGALENRDYNAIQPYTSGASYPGQNLIANSYTAAIDISKIVFGSQMHETVYLYNTGSRNEWIDVGQGTPLDSTSNLTGQYTAVPMGHVGEAGLPGQIPSMQAFIVRAKMASVNATVSIPYSTATTMVKNTDRQRADANSQESGNIWTRIDLQSSLSRDRLWIFTDAKCTHSFDNGYDGEKFSGTDSTPQIFAMEDDGDYQVNTVNDINNSWIGFRAGTDSIYTLTFRHQNIASLYSNIYLVDLVSHISTDITTGGASYTFYVQPNSPVCKRFKIITNLQIPVNSDESTDENSKIMIFASQQILTINNITAQDGNLLLFDLTGQFLSKFPFKANTVTSIDTGLSSGSYLAKAVTPTEKISRQFIMK